MYQKHYFLASGSCSNSCGRWATLRTMRIFISYFKADSQNSGIGKVAEDSRFSYWKRQNVFSPKSTQSLGHVAIHCVFGDITLGIKRQKREAEYLLPSSADVNLAYRCTSNTLRFVLLDLCLIFAWNFVCWLFFSIFTSIEKILVNTADIIVKIPFYQQMNFY